MTARGVQWDVVGIGANSVDYVNLLPGYPQPFGSFAKMRIRKQTILCGGQMATAMATCASLGLRAKYVGVTGTDDNGRRIRQELAGRSIDVSDVIIRDGSNQFAVILVDETTGDRIVLWDRDDQLMLRDRELPADAIGATRLVHVDDVDQAAAIRAARLGRERGAIVTSDIDRITDATADLIEAVTIPILAEHVPSHVTGLVDSEAALRKLRERHDGLLVITLGDRGAIALEGDRIWRVPAFAVEALDTTGAGDVFRGGFIYALLQGWPIGDVLRFANAAAAVSCTRLGAMNGVPALTDVTAMMVSGEVRK
jgi:sugar/nucleoside kinase (ribokinase family)